VEVHDSAWISLIKKPTTTTHTMCVWKAVTFHPPLWVFSCFFPLMSCIRLELLIRYLRRQNISYFFTLSMPCRCLLCIPAIYSIIWKGDVLRTSSR
jgi:hypothetical protein